MAKLILNGNRFGRVYVNEDSLTNIIIDGEPHKLKRDTASDSIVLCHFEDDFVNNQFTDAKGNVFTKSGSNVSISTGQSKFGTKSLFLTGSSYITSNVIDALWFNTGDFTIDCWVYTWSSYRQTILYFISGGIYIDIQSRVPNEWFSNPTRGWKVDGDSGSSTGGRGTISLPNNEWAHVALVRNGSYYTLYINGKLSKRVNIGSAVQRKLGDISVKIGSWDLDNYYFTGYIDELRIVGKAMWTDEFTPPTEPYTK